MLLDSKATASFEFDPPDAREAGETAALLSAIVAGQVPDPNVEFSSVESQIGAAGEERAAPYPVRAASGHGPAWTSGDCRRARKEALARNGELNAFVKIFGEGEPDRLDGPVPARPLADAPFAFKDVFVIGGHRPGAGTDQGVTEGSAPPSPVIARLLALGATPVGATNLDPWCYSTSGQNPFLGAPVNPGNPELIVGGSSSGSAVAVAAGIVPFALGTDTGGSVRIPAALCGVHGFKPTNGALETAGIVPLSKSHDCPGLLASDPAVLKFVAGLLYPPDAPVLRQPPREPRLGFAGTCFDHCDETVATGGRIFVSRAAEQGLDVIDIDGPNLDIANSAAAIVTGVEAVAALGPLYARIPGAFPANVRQRLATGNLGRGDDYRRAQIVRARMLETLLSGTFRKCDAMIVPVTPSASYRCKELDSDPARARKLNLDLLHFNRWVNLLGLPSVTIPVCTGEQSIGPSVQIIGRPHSDLDLLDLVQRLAQ